jgi:5-formyltetrahydrofolate cyclo-ligase
MDVEIQKAKGGLRRKIRAALEKIPLEKRKLDSQKLCAKLKEQSFFQSATSVLFFAPLPDEQDLWPLLEETLAAGKVVALPCFDAENQLYTPRRVSNLHAELVSGRFGIREPAASCTEMPLADLDLVLVPGVAFDLRGHRLGRGKGFYDRWLADFTGKKIGVAFDEQLVNAIPAEKRDVRMDFILTPTRCVKYEM